MTTQSGRSGGIGARQPINPPNCPNVTKHHVMQEARISYYQIKRDNHGMWWGKPIVTHKTHRRETPEWITLGVTNYWAWRTLYWLRIKVYEQALGILKSDFCSICEALDAVTCDNPEVILSDPLPQYYPEIWKQRPEGTNIDTGYWWRYGNLPPRIKVMENAITEMYEMISNFKLPKYVLSA